MTISIWRYSHLALAIATSLFLFVATLTGIVLAFEPISDAARPYAVSDLKEVTLAETVAALRAKYAEVLELEVDANEFVIASVITEGGDNERIYVDAVTGEKLGVPTDTSPIFQWTTNLHRSLFLKGIGRFFVGLVSFLLCLITITGFFLLAQRQGGFKRIFAKIPKEHFAQRFHVIFGRWFLLPVLIVAATGVYLSAEKFSLLPSDDVKHDLIRVDADYNPENARKTLPRFQDIFLDDVRRLTFPFSEAPEDYFELALQDQELYVDQYSGAILSEVDYPMVTLLSRFSLIAHTGQGSILWSLVLLVTSISVLFFMFTGFAMALKRRKKVASILSPKNKDECEYILLVGSETGSTRDFATLFENALTKAGKTVFKTELNAYSTYEKARYLIIFTATYGEGDAPTNARNFKQIFTSQHFDQKIQYSVLGFGALLYPDYCKFASDVDALLKQRSGFSPLLPLYKINDQSFEAFSDWVSKWSSATGIHLHIEPMKKTVKPIRTKPFTVVQRTDVNTDATFLIRLRPQKKIKFRSGDLLAYSPNQQEPPRLYSIARMDSDILLSIKKHKYGVSSNYFSGLSENDRLEAGIQRNPSFHFPKYAKEIVCIANGTGIAPFLGIINENVDGIPIQLFWGGRTMASFETYRKNIELAVSDGKLSALEVAYSRENGEKRYVQDLIVQAQESIAEKLRSGSVFMICGSIAMQNQVLAVLEEIAASRLKTTLSEFEHNEQLKMDCY